MVIASLAMAQRVALMERVRRRVAAFKVMSVPQPLLRCTQMEVRHKHIDQVPPFHQPFVIQNWQMTTDTRPRPGRLRDLALQKALPPS